MSTREEAKKQDIEMLKRQFQKELKPHHVMMEKSYAAESERKKASEFLTRYSFMR